MAFKMTELTEGGCERMPPISLNLLIHFSLFDVIFFSFGHPREINNQCFVYAFTELLLEIEKKIISVKQSRNNGSDNHSREFQQYLRQHGYFLLINKSTVLIFLCLLPDYFSCELLVWF